MGEIVEFLKALGWFWVTLVAAMAAALVLHVVLRWLLRRVGTKATAPGRAMLARYLSQPTRWTLLVAAAWLVMPLAPLAPAPIAVIRHVLGLVLIGLLAWTLVRLARTGSELLLGRYQIGGPDPLRARKIHTQLRVMHRLVAALAILLAVGAMLMTFDTVRQFGASLLASAGVAGIVIGVAAQRSLGSVIAGVQLAITQPLRLDDVVIVEGEWGRVEEITLTYVVVRIWDLRRLVLPATYFIEQPFQNWSRSSENLLGTVMLYTDYRVPVQAVRDELHRILEADARWDRQAWSLVVTNATERTVELRAMVSAADAGLTFALRAHVREKLLEFLRDNYPDSLPRVRIEQSADATPPAQRQQIS